MAHARKTIRDFVKATLEPALPSHRVFASRKYAINESELPIVDMRFGNENSQSSTMGDKLDREAALYVRVSRSATGVDIDDALDADAVIIEAAMANADWKSINVRWYQLVQTNWSDNAEGERPIGDLIIRFDIGYRTTENDPETIIK